MENVTKGTGPSAIFLNEKCGKANGGDLILLGMKSFGEIKGLTFHYIKGVVITLFFVAVIFTVEIYLLYNPYVAPFIDYYVDKINDFWSWFTYLATPVGWILKFISWILMVFAAMKVASLFMGFWLDTLVEKVIRHFRDLEDMPFSFQKTSKAILKGLLLSSGNMIFALIFLILGFIPVIGPVFAFIGSSCSNGFDIMSPYLMILSERDEELLKDFKITKNKTFLGGIVQTILNFVPLIGWLVLPFSLIAQVIGYTYYCESRWQKESISTES